LRVQIIPAHPADAPALSAIAWAAKAHWGYPAAWLEQWREQLTVSPEFIAVNDTFVAWIDDRIVAFSAVVAVGEGIHLDHLWVLPEEMGQGIGRSVFTHAAARARARGASRLTIQSDPHAEAFYLHLGAIRVGAVASEIEGQRRELPLLHYDLTSVVAGISDPGSGRTERV
jgi:GNAT superfamily N-acetyltransferase